VSGKEPGHPLFLGALQDATTTLWNELDAEGQEDYVKAAKEWSQDAPPKPIQSRYAIIHALLLCFLLHFLDLHPPCASGSSRTFKVNCSRPVAFAPWSSQHMRAKIIILMLACESSPYKCQLVSSDPHDCIFSDDGHGIFNDGHNFLEFCPDWKSAVLWPQWVQFGMKCFSKGSPYLHPCL
jgi:hypothetical protein